jgi:hypothetical protein
VLADVQPSPEGPNLRPIYDRVQASMSTSNDSMLVIFDDITILEWIGFPLIDIIRFSRALRALRQKVLFLILHVHVIQMYSKPCFVYSSTQLYSSGII